MPTLELPSPTGKRRRRCACAEIPLFGVLTAKITFQSYRTDPNMDPALFKLDPAYAEGEVKFRGM